MVIGKKCTTSDAWQLPSRFVSTCTLTEHLSVTWIPRFPEYRRHAFV